MEKMFKLSERGTTVNREIVAGLTTFVTMVYVLVVQPAAMVGFGPDSVFIDSNGVAISKAALVVMCSLITSAVTLFMGFYANLPIALSTGMGVNFILGGLIQSGQFSFGWTMAVLLVSGIIFILVTVFGIRKLIVEMLPPNMKIAIAIAVGFFIAYLGFSNSGIAVFSNGLKLGNIKSAPVLLSLGALLLMGILTAFKVRGALLIGIISATIAGIPLGVTKLPASLVSLPVLSDVGNVFFNFDFKSLLANISDALVWIFILFINDFFATVRCVMAVGVSTNMLDKNGDFPNIEKPFLVDAVGTVAGACAGCTTVTCYIESIAGIEEGGRTGLTAVTTGILFLICILFAPLFLMIPNAATGPALIFVGFSLLSSFTKMDFSDFKELFGPFIMIMLTTFTGDLASAVCAGVLADVIVKVCTGNFKKVHPVIYVVCIPMILYFVLK
jgi:AGZA family xanthine/uracil permease-like MFS transporter